MKALALMFALVCVSAYSCAEPLSEAAGLLAEKPVRRVSAVAQAAGQEAAGYAAVKEVKDALNSSTKPPALPSQNQSKYLNQSRVQETVQNRSNLAYNNVGSANGTGVHSTTKISANGSKVRYESHTVIGGPDDLDEKITTLMYTVRVTQAAKAKDVHRPETTPQVLSLRNRLERMDPSFKAKLASVAENGSEKEKEIIRERIHDCLSPEKKKMAEKLTARMRSDSINHTLVRMMLKARADVDEILESL